jgi:hypothetical protein
LSSFYGFDFWPLRSIENQSRNVDDLEAGHLVENGSKNRLTNTKITFSIDVVSLKNAINYLVLFSGRNISVPSER